MKELKRITKVLVVVCYIFIVVTMLLFLPVIWGKRPMIVLSGSMEPTFSEGSLIYMQKAEFDELEVGDIVVYGKDQVISHRVIEKRNQTKSLMTRGDANAFADAEVAEEMVLGKVWERLHIPYAGYLVQIFRKPEMIMALFLIMMLGGGLEDLYEDEYIENNIKNPLY